ncbi:MAG TPA: hypothetical protein VI298_13175 [Geobacteraceae bacterium]
MKTGKAVMHVLLAMVLAVSVSVAGTSEAASVSADHRATVHHGISVSFETHSAECGVCHATRFAEWRFAAGSDMKTVGVGSYHAIGSTEPMYTGMLGMMDQSMHEFCQGCHQGGNALAVVDKVNDIPASRPANPEEGTNCLSCHFDGKKIVGGKDLADPVFCAACHNEKMGMMSTYVEWLNDYKGGKTCQQCHMEDGSHVFLGYNSPSFIKKAIAISEPVVPETVSAGAGFDISFTLANNGVGHSVPEELIRLMRAKVSITDVSGQEIFSQETIYCKRHPFFGENPADTVVIKAGETKQVSIPGVVIASPGIYTVSVELLQDSNRLNPAANTTAFMGSTYKTITVQ